VALVGGIANIFGGALGLTGLLGFLFWTTAFISGSNTLKEGLIFCWIIFFTF